MKASDPRSTRDSSSGAEPTRVWPDGSPGRSDAFDVRQLIGTVRRHWRFVLTMAALTFVAVMTVTLLSRPVFRSVARVYLGELDDGKSSAANSKDEIDISAATQGVVDSEVEIIQSRSLVTRAILASGLNVVISDDANTPPSYGSWLLARRDPTLLDGVARHLRAQDSKLADPNAEEQLYGVSFVTSKRYEVWRGQERVGSALLGQGLDVPGAHLELDAGSDGEPAAGAHYALLVRPLQRVTEEALKALDVTAPRAGPQAQAINVVTLEFAHASPRLAASFLRELIAAYLKERQSWKVENAGAAEEFVENQLRSMRKSLGDVEKKLADYRSNNRVVVLDDEAKAMIEQVGKYEEQRVAARLEAAALSDIEHTLQKADPPVGAFMLGESGDSVLEQMASSLSEARSKLTDLQARFNDAAPDVRDQKQQVDAQLDAIRNYVANRSARAQANLGTLNAIIGQFEERLKTVPGAELGMLQLSRQSEVYSKTYSYLLERQQQTAIIKASNLSKNRVLDVPEVPWHEDSPKLLFRLASAPLGLLLGVLLVLGQSFVAGTFQSEADARGSLLGLPLLARVPRRARRAGKQRSRADFPGVDWEQGFIEAFRTLRANLYQLLPASSERGHVLLVTSPAQGDGKTCCARALAALLAADGKRVLLLDADLRRPRLGATQPGLSEVLSGEHPWSEAITPVRLGPSTFYSMASGTPAAPELLSEPRFDELLEQARARCDFVLLDAPSFPSSADALVLAAKVDLVLSVVRLGCSPRKLTLEHLQGLRGMAPLTGVLLNGVEPGAEPRRAERPATTSRDERPKPQRRAQARPGRLRALASWLMALLLLAAATPIFTHRAPITTRSDAPTGHAG